MTDSLFNHNNNIMQFMMPAHCRVMQLLKGCGWSQTYMLHCPFLAKKF